MILTENGVLKLMQRIKSFIASQLNTKASSVHTHSISEIDNLASQLGGGYTKSEVDTLLNGKSDTSHTHTKSQITDFPSYGTTANTICEGNDSRLSDARTPTSHTHTKSEITDFPTIPTVNNATLTIQKNGTTVKTFTANASSNVTANITVPTKVSELTNDSGFLTSHQSLSNYSTLANTIKSLSISGKTITYTKGDDTTGTLTTQDNNTWTAMVGATSSSNGSVGYVNAVPPKDGYNTKYLRADGTWQVPPDHTYNVYNKTLTIQKNGTNVATFTSNSNTDVTANISVPTKTSDLTNDSGFITSAVLLPIGSYIQFAGSQAPAGFLVCNGGAISRTTYSKLFAVIGTTYGSGDGSTTFNLPNLTDRFLQGSTSVGTVKNAGLPNIIGRCTPASQKYSYSFAASGAFSETSRDDALQPQHYVASGNYDLRFDASRSNSIYGNSTTVQPPALTCLICIKY